MARLEFFVVSRSISIDQSTNLASIFDILDVVQPDSFPKVIPDCVAFSLWRQEPGDEKLDFQLTLNITTPAGGLHQMRTNFRLAVSRHRVMQRIVGLPLEKPGELRFEAVLNGEHKAEHVVDVQDGSAADSANPRPKPA